MVTSNAIGDWLVDLQPTTGAINVIVVDRDVGCRANVYPSRQRVSDIILAEFGLVRVTDTDRRSLLARPLHGFRTEPCSSEERVGDPEVRRAVRDEQVGRGIRS